MEKIKIIKEIPSKISSIKEIKKNEKDISLEDKINSEESSNNFSSKKISPSLQRTQNENLDFSTNRTNIDLLSNTQTPKEIVYNSNYESSNPEVTRSRIPPSLGSNTILNRRDVDFQTQELKQLRNNENNQKYSAPLDLSDEDKPKRRSWRGE